MSGKPFGSSFGQTGTDGVTHETLGIVGWRNNGTGNNSEEPYGRWLLFIEVVGQAKVMTCHTLTAQHR